MAKSNATLTVLNYTAQNEFITIPLINYFGESGGVFNMKEISNQQYANNPGYFVGGYEYWTPEGLAYNYSYSLNRDFGSGPLVTVKYAQNTDYVNIEIDDPDWYFGTPILPVTGTPFSVNITNEPAPDRYEVVSRTLVPHPTDPNNKFIWNYVLDMDTIANQITHPGLLSVDEVSPTEFNLEIARGNPSVYGFINSINTTGDQSITYPTDNIGQGPNQNAIGYSEFKASDFIVTAETSSGVNKDITITRSGYYGGGYGGYILTEYSYDNGATWVEDNVRLDQAPGSYSILIREPAFGTQLTYSYVVDASSAQALSGEDFIMSIKVKMNRIDTNAYQDIRDEEVLFFANDAHKSLILDFDAGQYANKYGPSVLGIYLAASLVQTSAVALVDNSIALDDIGTLKVKDVAVFVEYTHSNGEIETGWQPVRELGNTTIADRNFNPFEESQPDRPVFNLTDRSINIEVPLGSPWNATQIKYLYLRTPNIIEEDSVIDIPYLDELEDKTVTLLLENLEGNRLSTQPITSRT